MHVDTDALVGGKLFITNSDNGQVIYTIKDTDTDPTIEFNSCRFIQTEALTELGVAVKPYGVITVSTAALAFIAAGADASKFHVTVQFGDEFYWIDLASLMAMDTGADVSFSERPAEYEDGEPLPGTGGGGGSGVGGIVVEFETTETVVEGSHYLMSTGASASDVLDEYKKGAHVVFHIPKVQLSGIEENYLTLFAYVPDNEYNPLAVYTSGGGSFTGIQIINDKFAAGIYYD